MGDVADTFRLSVADFREETCGLGGSVRNLLLNDMADLSVDFDGGSAASTLHGRFVLEGIFTGETLAESHALVADTVAALPRDKPRVLPGAVRVCGWMLFVIIGDIGAGVSLWWYFSATTLLLFLLLLLLLLQ
jgi:hypothetical protein